MYWFTLAVYSMWLCNVVAMFSYANIVFEKNCLWWHVWAIKVGYLFANPALVAYKPVAYIKKCI